MISNLQFLTLFFLPLNQIPFINIFNFELFLQNKLNFLLIVKCYYLINQLLINLSVFCGTFASFLGFLEIVLLEWWWGVLEIILLQWQFLIEWGVLEISGIILFQRRLLLRWRRNGQRCMWLKFLWLLFWRRIHTGLRNRILIRQISQIIFSSSPHMDNLIGSFNSPETQGHNTQIQQYHFQDYLEYFQNHQSKYSHNLFPTIVTNNTSDLQYRVSFFVEGHSRYHCQVFVCGSFFDK